MKSSADGSFELSAKAGDDQYLVVQMREFMRVTKIDVTAGVNTVSNADSSLPRRNLPAQGAVHPQRSRWAWGLSTARSIRWLASDWGKSPRRGKLENGSEPFDVWSHANPDDFETFDVDPPDLAGTLAELVSDPALLGRYHILFIPCTYPMVEELILGDDAILANIRDWVAAGGMLYVSHFSVNWVEKAFPSYQVLYRDGAGRPSFNIATGLADATIGDSKLEAWLDALPDALKDVNPIQPIPGLFDFPTLANLPVFPVGDPRIVIRSPLPQVIGPDSTGMLMNIGHRMWMTTTIEGGAVPVVAVARKKTGTSTASPFMVAAACSTTADTWISASNPTWV